MNFSAEHNNWLAVGEMIRMIKKPISSYVGQIVKNFHAKLCQDFHKNSKCKNTKCKKITPSGGLCNSCSKGWWLGTLKASHKKGNNPSWSKNCDHSKWYDDHWEVAKFFMSALGKNKSTVKDAESTDLSSLLNVMDWMNDDAFLGETRVNERLTTQLREVRNTWAHAPDQDLSEQQKKDYFIIAADFLKDLKNVFPDGTAKIEETRRCLDTLKEHGVTNIVKSEIENLLLTFNTLSQIKEELVETLKDSLADKKAIEDLTNQLEQVKNAMGGCSKRMEEFGKLKDNINQQFESFGQQLQLFGGGIRRDISDINEKIQLMSTDIKDIKKMTELLQDNKENRQEVRSCLPENIQNFAARGKEIEHLIKFVQKENTGIVSLHGGPGFGKSALAVEVSHRLNDEFNILVIFTDMSTASSIDEVTMRICRDLGINPEDDAKSSLSSLSLMLKKLKKEVVFVWDDIDNLLESDVRSHFDEFIRLLRKNSNQKLKIITTSRASHTIQSLSCEEIEVEEMDEESSMELLKSTSPDHNDGFLRSLAQLCGYVPLAMCIAVSLVKNFENPEEILKHLEDQPMTVLSNSETNQFVHKAFSASYIYLPKKQRDALLRLTVFEGDFSEHAVKAVMEGEDLQKKVLLIDLVNRSLVKKSGSHRYSIHVLIKSFLSQQSESVQEREKAERLMVAYYLELCNRSTIQSYTKDKFMENREILKREAHNIEAVLTICTSKQNKPEILSVLVDSEIYKRSCRFFYNNVRTIVSENVLTNFLQSCADFANEKEDWSRKINFDCILADQEGRKSFWKSDKYLEKMKATEEEFEKYQDDLTEDIALQAYFFYQLGRYLLNQSKVYKDNADKDSALVDLLQKAHEYLHKSLELRNKFLQSAPNSPLAKVDVILSLMLYGNLWKKISGCHKSYPENSEKDREKSSERAIQLYKEAIRLAKSNLGKHEISATCYKILGDIFLQMKENKTALEYYETVKCMREELSLNTSEEYVLLLNNIGRCLMFMKNYPEAVVILEIAQDIADKLVDDDCPTVGKGKIYTSLARTYMKSHTNPGKAKEFAEKAIKVNEEKNNTIIQKQEICILQKIIDNSSSMGQA